MSHILVVDDKAIFRDLVSASLQQAGYRTSCACGGQEALAALQSAPRPELMLLDLNMPDVDGLTVLRTLRKQNQLKKLPVILLTAASDKSTIIEAAKLGVQGCILKDRFSLADMLSRIEQIVGRAGKEQSKGEAPAAGAAAPALSVGAAGATAVGAAEISGSKVASGQASDADATADALAKTLGVPRLLTREQCLERAEKALQGKALSGVVAQVIQLAASPRSETVQVAESIGHDPMLTAKILRVANSTVYTTGRGPVTNIADAIKKVGFSTVRNITATVGVFDAMPTGGKGNFDPIRCWQHSFAVAILSERLAATPDGAGDGATAYLVGLCHDLGEILFQTCFGNEYKQVLEAHSRTNHPMGQLEEAMLGVPCSELMLLTLRSLQLPDAIRLPIEAMRANAPAKDRLCSILGLADIYANGMQLASSARAPVRSFSNDECRLALGELNGPAIDREKIRGEIFALTALLSQTSDADLTKPLFPRTGSRIWLAREVGLSKLDPIEAALDSLGKVQVSNRLPTPQQAAGIKAVVVDAQNVGSRTMGAENIAAMQSACNPKPAVLWLVQEGEAPATQKAGEFPQPLKSPVPLETVATVLAA